MRGPGLRRGDSARWMFGFYHPDICACGVSLDKFTSRYDFNGTVITLHARFRPRRPAARRTTEVRWLLRGVGWWLIVATANEDMTIQGFRGDECRAVEDLMAMRLLFP